MPYDIVFVEPEDPSLAAGKDRGAGSVFLSNLPASAKVFAFFYPSSVAMNDLVERLRSLGRGTGDNLFVNIGSLRDPDYRVACERFGVGALPVIIITAISPLAATPAGQTAYVRLDRKSLFAQPDELLRTVEELFNLFLAGKIREAMFAGWVRQSKAGLLAAAKRIWGVIEPIVTWAARRDIKLAFATMKIE